jgi:hypothetical protein
MPYLTHLEQTIHALERDIRRRERKHRREADEIRKMKRLRVALQHAFAEHHGTRTYHQRTMKNPVTDTERARILRVFRATDPSEWPQRRQTLAAEMAPITERQIIAVVIPFKRKRARKSSAS